LQRSTGIIRPHSYKLLAMARMLDNGVVILALALVLGYLAIPFDLSYLLIAIGASLLFGFFAEVYEVYHTWRGSAFYREARRLVFAWFCAILVLTAALYLSGKVSDFSRTAIVSWAVVTAILLVILHGGRLWLTSYIRRRGRNIRTCAILGANPLGKRLEDAINSMPWLGLKFVGYYDDRSAERQFDPCQPVVGTVRTLFYEAKNGKVDYIYICLDMSAEKRICSIVDELADTTASVFYIPNFFVFKLIQAHWFTLQGIPVVSVYETPFQGVDAALKRTEDIVLSCLILLLVSVPMALIALGVKLSSPGPVLFKQRRYGFNGEEIIIWKFRSMTVCEDGGEVEQARKEDPRVTPLGAFLRKTSLDELPQFLNVLQGSMSIVGPRPHAVIHNEHYRKLIPGYMLRHKVKPGITGLAQINGFRGETETIEKMEARIQHDIEYIRHWSLLLDIKIILLTVLKGFTSKNAY